MKKFLLLALFLSCLVLPCSVLAASDVRVERGVYYIDDVEGYAEIKDGKKTAAREEARRMAYHNAIEKALEECVPGIIEKDYYQTVKDRIFSRTSNLIKNFKANETVEGNTLKIIGKCQINEKNLDVIWGPEVIAMLGNPRIMLVVDERVGKDAPFISTVEAELLKVFEKAGYLIVDPDQAKMLLQLDPQKAFNDPSLLAGAARTLRADIIILARAVAGAYAKQKVHGINLYGVSGTVQLKAVFTQTAYQISSKTISGGTGKKPVLSVGAGAGRIFKSGITQAAEEIIYKIAYGLASMNSSLGTVNIKISNASFKQVEEIEKFLTDFAGKGGNLYERSFNNGVVEIDLVSGKNARNVASVLSEYPELEIQGITTQTISARMGKAPTVITTPTEPDVVIKIHIENLTKDNHAETLEKLIRSFITSAQEIKVSYNNPIEEITITYSNGSDNVKTTKEISDYLKDNKEMKIIIETFDKENIAGYRKGGLLGF